MDKALLITVDVEEWYHSRWFDVNKITSDPRSLCEKDLDSVLDLFRRLNISATFFVLGEIAEKSPELVEKIVKEGHEVACHGYNHNSMSELGEQEFKDQTKKAKGIIKRILGQEPLGYRAPNSRISTEAINILENLGFHYDSSVMPCWRIPGWYGDPFAPITPYKPSRKDISREDCDRDFWEVPVAVFPRIRLPGGGGWYLRNFGYLWTRTIVKMLLKKGPATLYVHPWEVSDNRPNLDGIPFHVFRRKGRYVRDTITGIVKHLKVNSITIRDFLEKECL